ncbi:MAG: PEP-CTERM sorting domain-containing protein [Planctomycetales bacterium]|nr:PEP-CTERM sorting domain-containing protein [Planctomycetales bacterium]
MTHHIRITRFAAALLAVALVGRVSAQTDYNWQVSNGDWDSASSWDLGFPPDTAFDETANISNGGTAVVSNTPFSSPGQVDLGRLEGESGALTIANGGNLAVVFTPGNTSTGNLNIGLAGTGVVGVQPGGTLSARRINLNGAAGNSLTIGGAGAGVASVSTEFEANLDGATRIIGPNANISVQSLFFRSTSVYTPEITAATHSPIKSTNLAQIAGTLRPEFNGVTPTAGSTWNLIDAPDISGSFAIDASAAPTLPYGQVYQFSKVADGGSVNGTYGQLSVKQLLVLNVDRATGAMSINTGPASVSLDGYSIGSTLGGLKPAGWNSLQDQAVGGWREAPQNGSVNDLSELKSTGATTVTSGSPLALGNAFQFPNPTQFGTELEDITFEYYSAGGVVTQGLVNYIGTKRNNNLVLLVDPDTGEARMENQSTLGVNIDGYAIQSESGSLLSGPGQWNSLDDQNAAGGDWRESNPSATLLAELKPTSSAAMIGGTNFGYSLGTLFKTEASGGTEDLTFKYLVTGDTTFSEGVVEFRSFDAPGFLSADFNQDTQVDGGDLTAWESAFGNGAGADANNDGKSDGADFLIWQRQFGLSSATAAAVGAAGAVPEPATLCLVSLAIVGAALRRRSVRFA